MELRGTPQELWTWLARPGSDVLRALGVGQAIPSQLLGYQQAALFILTTKYNHDGAAILDIGTAAGHSAVLMALAAPKATIVTLDPRERKVEEARENLRAFASITVVGDYSWDFLERNPALELDMVFVDGDHKRVRRDLPWWEHLRPRGLMLFHDYSPQGARVPCPPVYEAVDRMAVQLGRRPDVLIVDSEKVGMAGFYRRTWTNTTGRR